MTPPDRWREAAREIRQTMKDADLVWSLISEGKLTGMLRRLFPAREEGWVSVDEQLPNECVDYLVYSPEALIRISTFGADTVWLDEGVTHWQSLPEGPAESERQKEEK